MEVCRAVDKLIQKYEGVLAGLEKQSVEDPEAFNARAKLAFLKSWYQVIEDEESKVGILSNQKRHQ